jgi:hypothetical protein
MSPAALLINCGWEGVQPEVIGSMPSNNTVLNTGFQARHAICSLLLEEQT